MKTALALLLALSRRLQLLLGLMLWAASGLAATVRIDLTPTGAGFPMLWGANIGPLGSGVATNPPVTPGYHDLGVRLIRTHDYFGPLDMRQMYPNQGADPALPASYNFGPSDDVWRAILTNGFWPYFRLGNSYSATGPYAPTNRANWIEAAVQVIRRYRDASRWGTNALRQVEIWNEPDNARFWEQGPTSRTNFFSFFTDVARRLRAEFPDLKLGGPGVTPAAFLAPANTNYIPQFLDHLRSNNVSLDFLSWHVYSNDPHDYVRAARFYRACLDARGFTHTEQHVTEYNSESRNNDVAVRAWLPGAAINTAAWMAMQQEDVALATIYRGPDPDIVAPFFYGIFYADAQPKAVALSSKLCTTLAAFPHRLSVTTDDTNLWAMAGRRDLDVALLLSNPTNVPITWSLSLSDERVPQQPRLIEIVPVATNATYPNVIYWAFRTNDLGPGPYTLSGGNLQFITFSILSDLDHWAQTVHGLTGTNAAPGADPDGDGANNEAEFVAGTNPTNALSRLVIESVSATGGHVTLGWTPAPGRRYAVQNAPLPATTNGWVDLVTNLTTGAFTHSNAPPPGRLYRLRVVVP